MKVKIIRDTKFLKNKIYKKQVLLIDVFRATSTIAFLTLAKNKRIYLSESYKNVSKEWMMSEKYSILSDKKIKKDFDNSPTSILNNKNLKKNIILISEKITKIANKLSVAKNVICGSFVNFYSVIRYIKKKKITNLYILPSGDTLKNKREMEDDICAEAFKDYLTKSKIDIKKIYNILSKAINKRLKNIKKTSYSDSLKLDLILCSSIGLLNSVPKLQYSQKKICCVNVSKKL